MKTVALKYSVKDTLYFYSNQNKSWHTNIISPTAKSQNILFPSKFVRIRVNVIGKHYMC